MVYRILLVVLASLLCVNAKVARLNSCGFPNSTDVRPNTYSCNRDAPLQVLETILTDKSGKPMYPIDPKKPIILDLKAINHGVQYNDDKVKVKLYSYTSSWLTGECSWQEIPTFGLLSNIDGCQVAHNCPLTVGKLDLKLELDLSKYAAIIEMLVSNSAYQIRIQMYDNNKGSRHEEIACAISQLRFV